MYGSGMMEQETSGSALVLPALIGRSGLVSLASWIEVVNAVAGIPYGRAPGSTAVDVLAAWRGTCSGKHYLLAQALREGWPDLVVATWHRVYQLMPAQAEAFFGRSVAAVVPAEGLVDVHTYLTVEPGPASLSVDVTFPLEESWDGVSPMPLRCGDGDDVPAGDYPAVTKRWLVHHHCDPVARESFVAALSRQ